MRIQIRTVCLSVFAIVASAASAQTAVEWKVSEGGNGHWYLRWPRSTESWDQLRTIAIAVGGNLASVSSNAENLFIRNVAFPATGPSGSVALGGLNPGGACGGPWHWVDGSSWSFSAWDVGQPDCWGEEIIVMYASTKWHDYPRDGYVDYWNGAIIEWSADCNGDGIVDYGQILRGELDDDNANGIPDVCETSVTGVIPPSVPSQGGSTVTIKGANFPENPTVLIGGVPATDVVRLSATRVTATSPALLPGMTSISVNGFTLPEALYIRPECGSDLDQNGTVDTADISIILLDFGPCASNLPSPLLSDPSAVLRTDMAQLRAHDIGPLPPKFRSTRKRAAAE